MPIPGWCFDNSFTLLPKSLFTRLPPTPVERPSLVILNSVLAEEMGLDFSSLPEQECAELFAGNHLPEGADPIAQAYAGHQFGHFTLLGDGRALLLGEHLSPDQRRLDVQFKGSGRTPYSRGGDGRAALGPMLREYILSEAMQGLGIPTTRSLAVVVTGEPVYRETVFPGALLTRVAASHLRVGTFEYVAQSKDLSTLKALVEYALNRHYPERVGAENPALALLEGVVDRQLDLIVHWMRAGFIHGVMNTDNMTLSGETIDYGPCAFMNRYDPHTVFSSIDSAGRYAYGNQPWIAQWNLARFAETLLPLLHPDPKKAVAMAETLIHEMGPQYKARWQTMMRKKLGLFGEEKADEPLIEDLLSWMQQHGMDYTRTFRDLPIKERLSEEVFQNNTFREWYERWQLRLQRHSTGLESCYARMNRHNPAIIPRNHRVEEALTAANDQGELQPLQDLLLALRRPYQESPNQVYYQSLPETDEADYQTFCGT